MAREGHICAGADTTISRASRPELGLGGGDAAGARHRDVGVGERAVRGDEPEAEGKAGVPDPSRDPGRRRRDGRPRSTRPPWTDDGPQARQVVPGQPAVKPQHIFRCKLALVDDMRVWKRIKDAFYDTRNYGHTSASLKPVRVYEVTIPHMVAAFDRDGKKVGNVRELWHDPVFRHSVHLETWLRSTDAIVQQYVV